MVSLNVRPIAGDEAGTDLPCILLVAARPGTQRTHEPSVKAAARNTERFADPRHRPDSSVRRDKGEPHIESLAK